LKNLVLLEGFIDSEISQFRKMNCPAPNHRFVLKHVFENNGVNDFGKFNIELHHEIPVSFVETLHPGDYVTLKGGLRENKWLTPEGIPRTKIVVKTYDLEVLIPATSK